MAMPTALDPLDDPSHDTLHGFHNNVKAFGATGDGSTDDHDALQAALDEGGTVYVPSGTYLTSAGLTLPDGVRLIGASPTTSIIAPHASFSGTALLYAERRDNDTPNNYERVTIQSLKLGAPSSSSEFYALDMTGMRESEVRFVWFNGSGPGAANMPRFGCRT